MLFEDDYEEGDGKDCDAAADDDGVENMTRCSLG